MKLNTYCLLLNFDNGTPYALPDANLRMKTFLRDMATRQYFQSLEKWTPDRDDAYDFGFISRAMKIAAKLRIPELEVELSLDGPDEVATTPFAQFLRGLSHPRKRRMAGTAA